MLENGKLMDIIPFEWPSNSLERMILIENIKTELNQIIFEQPWLQHQVRKVKENLACQGPYFELIEEFCEETKKPHKLHDILNYIHTNGGQRVLLQQPLGPKRLQKLICDNYRIFGKNIFDYSAKQITFAHYHKINISTLKNIFNQDHIDLNTQNFIGHYATRKCQTFNSLWNNLDLQHQKFIHLLNCLKQIEQINQPTTINLNQFLNQQQIILCFILFCMLQCEELIALNLGEAKSQFTDIEIYPYSSNNISEDSSLFMDTFPKIADYFPKLAQKLQKRYKEVLKIPVFDQSTRVQIFNFTQQYLGFETNTQINLDINIVSDIQKILSNQYQERNIGLVILVANAKMYTQLMYSLM